MSAPDATVLNVPPVVSQQYARNFISMAVCELRFPTLFELESDRAPVGFSKIVRREYPTYELLKNVNLNVGGLAQANAHAFRSKKNRWTVTVRAAAISLETSNYSNFGEFKDRMKLVLSAAKETIDSDFLTRVGLRYINAIPFGLDRASGMINPALVGPLGEGIYGNVEEHFQRVRGSTEIGGFGFQHGLRSDQTQPDAAGKGPSRRDYVLDFDFFKEDVALAETLDVIQKLHELTFSMFDWALGPEAKRLLEASPPGEK